MELFGVKNTEVKVTMECLMIEPFKSIWKKDGPDIGTQKFTYIEFMSSMKKNNIFIGYKLEERGLKILTNCFPKITTDEISNIVNDPLVIKGIEVYNTIQQEASPAIRFYESAVIAADNLVEFFNTIDLDARNGRTGALLYKPKDITTALKDTKDILKTLGSLKSEVVQELYEDAKGKAGREINYFEKAKIDR
jgi:hypothetical protein